MNLLRELYTKDDLSKLPDSTISELEKLIREGAKDTSQEWSNALELVHKAYEVGQVQRPTPDMKDAWKQYEDLISLAVQQLAKTRGIDGKWRMSSHIFQEGAKAELPNMYTVSSMVDDLPVVTEVSANSIDEILAPIMKFNITGHDLEIKHRSPNHCTVYFCKDGKRTADKMTIKMKPVITK